MSVQGFDADHADIDLLRLRNYTIGRKLTDDELLTGGFDRITELLGCMQPFVSPTPTFRLSCLAIMTVPWFP